MFLLDTNVVAELRKASSARADANVVRWARSVAAGDLYLSVVSILEIELGVLSMERRDAAQGALLRRWFEEHVLPAFEDRILPIDTAVARRCARLHVPDRRGERDAFIAATAAVHGMTVVTRNVGDFANPGVTVLNPWAVPRNT